VALLDFEASAKAQAAPGEAAAPEMRDTIRFEGVAFTYPGGSQVFEELDLDLPVGRSTAIVGLNGAGKTTLVKLLARFYDPDAGRITLDGKDLREFDPHDWHRRLAVIFQDFIRYELTGAENIALADHPCPTCVGAAAQRAGAQGIGDLSRPMFSRYQGGHDLSGGQWQRLALARAFYATQAGASILVLDEPTAQLDVRAEVDFFDSFLETTRGLTTIVISHRFSTVRRADNIVVLEHGRVVEQGTHEMLIKQEGRYEKMFRLQARRFS
jgi:ATP-binding cassette subfamily B protein